MLPLKKTKHLPYNLSEEARFFINDKGIFKPPIYIKLVKNSLC